MYGPPPDPHQVAVTAPLLGWVVCLAVGLALAATRRRFFVVLGLTLALTAPAAWMVPSAVWGAWPTIDKTGSLTFFAQGVHRHLFGDDPAVRLIGVHLGHLWVTQLFATVLPGFAAMNAQALLNVVLGWYVTAVLFEAGGARRGAALAAALPFGLGLHVFRDITWYTIEKSGVYWLPLYALVLLKRPRWAPLVYVGAFFYNVYWGVLCAAIGAVALRWRPWAVLLSAVAALPLVLWQWQLMHGAQSLGDPQLFLTQRAALDTWSPLWWNRLEAWRACDPLCFALGVWGLRRRPVLAATVVGAALVAVGPVSPLFLVVWKVVPGFWRFAKPEVFFELSWLGLLYGAALEAPRWLAGWVVGFFCLSTRTHPVYPGFSAYEATTLPADWQESVPGF